MVEGNVHWQLEANENKNAVFSPIHILSPPDSELLHEVLFDFKSSPFLSAHKGHQAWMRKHIHRNPFQFLLVAALVEFLNTPRPPPWLGHVRGCHPCSTGRRAAVTRIPFKMTEMEGRTEMTWSVLERHRAGRQGEGHASQATVHLTQPKLTRK